MQIYNNALMINTACQPQDALEYVNDQLSTVRRGLPDAEISDSLDKLYFGKLITRMVITSLLL